MSFKNEKNKKNSFLDKDKKIDKSVSDAINEAFDQAELSSVGKSSSPTSNSSLHCLYFAFKF